jgi:ABC-type glycerol-3-phosphate transport system substrate-binding protein
MEELNLSIYGDQPSVLEGAFFDEFNRKHSVKVNVQRSAWKETWPKMLDFAIHGGGPDISQIGAIWTSSLVAMDVLRPINPREIAADFGDSVFYPTAWHNTLASESNNSWAVPFTTFTYALIYNRDLLRKAGVNEAGAFSSPEAMVDTLERLKAAKIESPLVLPSGKSYRGRVHFAASWVWGAGGEFIDGKNVFFDLPQAHEGLRGFFNLYRYLSPADHNLAYDECVRRVVDGQAAIAVTGVRNWSDWTQSPEQFARVGSAPMPGIPWVGGSSLVIWREVRTSINRERTTMELARYLTSPAAQIAHANAMGTMPARCDIVQSLNCPIPSLIQTFDVSMRTGRVYKPTLIWVRMLNDLGQAFDRITSEILSQPERDVASIFDRPISHLANRFRLMLNN